MSQDNKILYKNCSKSLNYLPVEERLDAPAIRPDIMVELQIVSIPMAWINLIKKEKFF